MRPHFLSRQVVCVCEGCVKITTSSSAEGCTEEHLTLCGRIRVDFEGPRHAPSTPASSVPRVLSKRERSTRPKYRVRELPWNFLHAFTEMVFAPPPTLMTTTSHLVQETVHLQDEK